MDNTGSPAMALTNACFMGWSFMQQSGVITAASALPPDFMPVGSTFDIIADVTLFAVWGEDKSGPSGVPDNVPDFYQLKVVYDGNGHTGGYIPVDINFYNSGNSITMQGNTGFMERTDACFIGWSKTPSPVVTSFATVPADLLEAGSFYTITADMTFYAVWAEDINGPDGVPDGIPDYLQNIVIYDGNGHTGGTVPVDNHLYNYGDLVTISNNTGMLEKTGACFIGWSNNPHLLIRTGPAIPADLVQGGNTFHINSPTTFYAVWAEDVNGPDGVPDGIPDYLQVRLAYHANSAFPATGGVLPIPNPTLHLTNTPVIIKGNAGNLVRKPADQLVFAGWCTFDGCPIVTNFASIPAGMLMAGDVLTIGTTAIDLYVVWAYDRNGTGFPDYLDPLVSIDPIHKWPNKE
jgi:hypothetical protein